MSRKKKSNELVMVLVCLLLVFTAVVCGYIFSNKLAKRIVSGDEEKNENTIETTLVEKDKQDIEQNTVAEDKSEVVEKNDSDAIVEVPIDMHPINVAFILNSYNISEIKLEILDCVKMEMLTVSIPGDISCTMSSELYKDLSAENVTIPQTVRFSELYKYYGDSRAYDAGRRVISEQFSINMLYYTACQKEDYYNSYAADSEKEIEYCYKKMMENAITNWNNTLRDKYLPVYNSLREVDVIYCDAPVKKNNESTVLDVSGAMAIILQSGVNLWENRE